MYMYMKAHLALEWRDVSHDGVQTPKHRLRERQLYIYICLCLFICILIGLYVYIHICMYV